MAEKMGYGADRLFRLNTQKIINKRTKGIARAYANRIKDGLPIGFEAIQGGRRPDLNNTFFRSAWEANYARYLDFIGVKWEYEKHSFEFETIKKGTRFYIPDFYLPEDDIWVEVKGYLRNKAKTKLSRFKRYYPEEFKKLKVVLGDPYSAKGKQHKKTLNFFVRILGMSFRDIESYKLLNKKWKSIIPYWE